MHSTLPQPLKVAIVGGGWAGMAAAVKATQAGHAVTVFETSRTLGGRARAMRCTLPDGTPVLLDNGQHIMIGAYRETLALMRAVGIEPERVLSRMPLTLVFPDGEGLRLPRWLPAPLDAAAGILLVESWTPAERWSLLRAALRWQWQGFRCTTSTTVAQLCEGMAPRVLAEFVEPLCVAALNIDAARASGQVFLRVLHDAMFAGRGGADLLLPATDLSALFPQPAAAWLARHGGSVEAGNRVQTIAPREGGWLVDGAPFEAVLLACPPWEAIRLAEESGAPAHAWLHLARGMAYEAIATVYATSKARLAEPMLALRSGPGEPAQFVFDRGQLGGPRGLLAFVASACHGERAELEAQVMAQAEKLSAQLGLRDLMPLQTVVEKRATFACTPGLRRPPAQVAPGLLACGDYVEGPYPATLEGAVRSALEAVALLGPRSA